MRQAALGCAKYGSGYYSNFTVGAGRDQTERIVINRALAV